MGWWSRVEAGHSRSLGCQTVDITANPCPRYAACESGFICVAKTRRRPEMQPACMSDVSAKLLYIVTVSTSSIVYIKSDFRKPSSLYSLHIKHSHTHTHTYAQYHTTAYQPLSSLWASPATYTTTSTANICDSILTGSLDWAIYSADQHPTYLALTPRIWQLQQYSHP
jgi:hypothetical protein